MMSGALQTAVEASVTGRLQPDVGNSPGGPHRDPAVGRLPRNRTWGPCQLHIAKGSPG
ncbi:rCG63375 [Rattus norvegicus]|uniref:RCG63375 n=1 Tax=Rattus norvegicus TaxID=10116 RepID=A6K6Y4_RAT|nr:rCG63375 [Rattus norvegicus]